MIRRPTANIEELRDSANDIITFISSIPVLEIKKIELTAVASSTQNVYLSTNNMDKLHGALQINATFTDAPKITYNGANSVNIRYDFSADTSGKQTATYLLIGS